MITSEGCLAEEMNLIRDIEKLGTRLPLVVIEPVRIWVGLNSILANRHDNIFT